METLGTLPKYSLKNGVKVFFKYTFICELWTNYSCKLGHKSTGHVWPT